MIVATVIFTAQSSAGLQCQSILPLPPQASSKLPLQAQAPRTTSKQTKRPVKVRAQQDLVLILAATPSHPATLEPCKVQNLSLPKRNKSPLCSKYTGWARNTVHSQVEAVKGKETGCSLMPSGTVQSFPDKAWSESGLFCKGDDGQVYTV